MPTISSPSHASADPMAYMPAVGMEVLLDLNRPAVAAFSALNDRLVKQVADFNEAWATFIERRLHEDLETARRLAHCGSPQEWVQISIAFAQTAVQDYQAELAALTRLGQDFSRDSIEIVCQSIDDATRASRH